MMLPLDDHVVEVKVLVANSKPVRPAPFFFLWHFTRDLSLHIQPIFNSNGDEASILSSTKKPNPESLDVPLGQTLYLEINLLSIVGSRNKIQSKGSILTPTFWQRVVMRHG